MPRIVIIGGGIGGLATALALDRRGAEVIVYEQSAGTSDIGGGLHLSPNALKALRVLGVEDAIIASGSEADFLTIRSWKSGRVISRMRPGSFRQQFGAPNVTVHRADLVDALRGALTSAEIRFGARCEAVEECGRGALARFADGREIEADIIVGADGIHSVVRNSVCGLDAPRFAGCICWRGMAKADAVPGDISIAHGTMWMGPHGHVVHYPVRRGELINIVAHFDSRSWTEESWTRKCDLSEVAATYASWHSDLLRLFSCSGRWYKWALYDREPAQQWSKGRITLLGDSAHAMLPYLGQGGAMAIEDGCVLAAAVARHADDLDTALLVYERIRAPRARAAVLGSRARARENHLVSRWARLTRDVKFAIRKHFSRDKTAFQSAWLYSYDVGRELQWEAGPDRL
ncbi:MAG: FAD-dependent monooxygenase [Xanthobacteraceae bacterium]|jgi:salicylate hydroxylase